MRTLPFLLASTLLLPAPVCGQARNRPIIDMHLHAAGRTQEWSRTRDGLISELDAYNVVAAPLFVRDTGFVRWQDAAPNRLLVSVSLPCTGGVYPDMQPCFPGMDGWPTVEWLRELHARGRLHALAEVLYVYEGIAPADERLEPYWALAEELDVPVGVHIGVGPTPQNRAPGCCPNFAADLGNPALLEPVLARHPGLRIWLQHAGGPRYRAETIALMQAHPNVYADMSVVNARAPAPAYAASVLSFIDAGLGDRIVFGSDNIDYALVIERTDALPITDAQRRAIYCDNAARFLRLDPGICDAAGGP